MGWFFESGEFAWRIGIGRLDGPGKSD